MRRKMIAIALVLLGAMLLSAMGGYFWLQNRMQNPSVPPVPSQIAGLQRTVLDTGAQAALEIGQLHGKGFPLTVAAVAIYQGEGNAQLWVAGAPWKWFSSRLFASMQERIASSTGLPFHPQGERLVNGRRVQALEGLGQQHFYFQSGNLVIWLAVDPPLAERALDEILQFYP